MTSLSEFKHGRIVYHKDVNHKAHSKLKMVVVRRVKKGILCAIEDGTTEIFKPFDIEVYPLGD